MAKAKRKIHEFNFKDEGAHIALVDKAANLQEVLIMKALEEQVTVSMSMKEFLVRFFHLWDEDAKMLAEMLGYDTDSGRNYNASVADNEIDNNAIDMEGFINGAIDSIGVLKGQDLPDKLPSSMVTKIEELQKQFDDKLKTSEGSPLEDNINIEKGESQVDKTEIEVKELETLKAAADEVATLKSQLEEMDSLKSLVDAMKAEKEEKAKSEMTEVVKGYSFIAEEDQGAVVEFLLKSEGSDVMLATLEKARDAITAAADIDQESGKDGGDVDLQVSEQEKGISLTSEILKNRKS